MMLSKVGNFGVIPFPSLNVCITWIKKISLFSKTPTLLFYESLIMEINTSTAHLHFVIPAFLSISILLASIHKKWISTIYRSSFLTTHVSVQVSCQPRGIVPKNEKASKGTSRETLRNAIERVPGILPCLSTTRVPVISFPNVKPNTDSMKV